ncbi:MAG: dihydropteroate synthase [Spirochaetaceae bacterium]|nr:MAG: dihydropteroate synthase [Spirochaetaceae bacterium]
MGILNCTPDSFYASSRSVTVDQAVAAARRMIDTGADMLDIGGESSRPGSDYVSAGQEIERVVPVISAVREFSDIPISVDTRKRVVAEAAVAAGADLINDISALRDDPELAAFAADRELPVILMHMRGTPRTMQLNPCYEDTLGEICAELRQFAYAAQQSGIARAQILLDPGIGFGKRLQDNLAILRGIAELRELGYPLVIGASRKSFIGALTDAGAPRPPEERLAGSLAVHAIAAQAGADILRVHDVPETVDVLRVLAELTLSEVGVS